MPPNFLSTPKPTTKRVGAKFNQALELHDKGQLLKAQALCEEILREQPDHFDSLHLLGVISYKNKRLQLAIDLMERAVKLNPNNADYRYNLGIVLHDLKQLDLAVASYDKAIQLDPNYAEAYYNRGNVLQDLRQLDAAVASYDKAVQLDPGYVEAYYNRGNALQDLGQLDAAVASYDKAIQLKPGYAKVYVNRGNALQHLKRFDAAASSYDKAVQLKPDLDYLSGTLLCIRMKLYDWSSFENNVAKLLKNIELGIKASSSLAILALTASLPIQRKVSEIWVNDQYPYNPSLGPITKLQRSNKIRVGYFSADFRIHPVSLLIAELFEVHDRSRFELVAFSFGPDTNDMMRKRVAVAFDKFIDVSSQSDSEVAKLARDLKIDIAIDLGGHTTYSRTGIFSYRAAPVQVSYLGYPSTSGADYMDYLIADKTIIPTQSQQYYSEKIVYLPNSFQVNDRKKVISDKKFTREEFGLPVEGFIFCCFNNSYKLTPHVFDSWVRILNAVEGSVSWLFEDNQIAVINLRKEAEKRGLDPRRLVFAKRVKLLDHHLARHRVADLFLDTLPYNAHTTASDALWAGLPVLTCMGESYASRVAASLLKSIGLPELITTDQVSYESLAIELATDPVKLRIIRDKLAANRLTTPLFDTPLFTRHIEDAYTEMYERYQNDLLPDHIEIKH
jgi:predicted O-linked N-acetylglucosamine transferase (SPINDLY family)